MILGSQCTEQRIYALAGVVQCATVVDEFATTGTANDVAIRASIEAFFLRDSSQISDYFDARGNVEYGLERLHVAFSNTASEERSRQISYTFQMIHLGKQMARRSDMLGVIGAGIDHMEMQKLSSTEMMTAIGDLYQKTISKLSFRIQVQGQHGYLRQEQTASTIRAILFCGIRFAHLWRQQGGTQMDFLLRKAQIRDISGRLASQAKSQQ